MLGWNTALRDVLPIRIATMDMCLVFLHKDWHQYILGYRSSCQHPIGYEYNCWRGIQPSTLPLRWFSGSQYCHREVTPISTVTLTSTPTPMTAPTPIPTPIPLLTAQPLTGTARLHTPFNNAPVGCSGLCDQVQLNTNHNWIEPCVAICGAVNPESSQFMPTAESTTIWRAKCKIDSSNTMSGRLLMWEMHRALYG